MKESKKIKRKLALVVGANMVVFFGYYYVFGLVKEENHNVAVFEKEINTTSIKDQDLIGLKNTIKETVSEREALDSHFVGSDGVVDFLEYINTLAKEKKIEVTVGNIDRVDLSGKGKGFLEKLIVQLSTEGDWDSVYGFLNMIESMPYKTSIEQVQLDKRENNEKVEVWKLSLRINVLKFI